ncbi:MULTISPECIES: DUF317 domain-containing protein [unclassified Kitasatospora]|uniref:DUF317 domain-containing protein n=1 Tax=unclassified Kitasatospora TaxID=2633591 RepID=UPI0033DE77E7
MRDDTQIDVAPRYLAGAGGDPGDALNLLIKKRNWPHHTDPENSSLFISSPCHRLRVAFMGDYLDRWQLVASADPMGAPDWMARFDGRTPVEIVGAFLETIAGDLEEYPEQVFNRRSYLVRDATRLVEQAGWKREFTANVIPLTAPDGLAGLEVRRVPTGLAKEFEPYDETVMLWAGPEGTPAYWEAHFTKGTPLHVIAAATRPMITPAPVRRHRADLAPEVLPHLTSARSEHRASSRAQAARTASPAAQAAGGAVVAPAAAVTHEPAVSRPVR